MMTSSKFKTLAINAQVGLGSLLVLLLVSACLSFKSQSDNNENTASLEKGNAILFEIESITATLNDAESAQRGYQLTGLPSFLAPFHGAFRKTLIKLYNLENLLSDDLMQQRRSQALGQLIRKRFSLLYRTLVAKNTKETLSEENALKSNIRTLTGALRETENRRLGELMEKASDSKRRTRILTLFFTALGLGTAGMFFFRISEEIVKRSRAEVELKLKNHRLEQYTRELEQIAYISSHDLKEPLRSIASYSELMVMHSGDNDKGKLQSYCDALIGKVRKLASIIDALNDFSRITNEEGKCVTVNCQDTLERIRKAYSDQIQTTNTLIKSDILPSVKGIPLQIEQVFQHLIDNAIKFRKPDQPPVIEIQVKEADHMWQFSIRDNGIGIDSKYSHKLFKVFNTLHSKDQYQGNGIGLAKCRKIVECHDGKIWLEPMSEGAAFSFTLPKA